MAKYRINGSNYEVDNAIQGDELNTTLTQLAETTAAQNQKKFLDFIGAAEGATYDTIVGGRQKITDFASHPNIVGMRTKEGPSTAAGKYQITGTTHRSIAGAAGTNDFSPESQDKMALALIARRGAADDVTSGNFNGAIAKLGKEWASLPSSTYSQGKRTQAWVDQQLGQDLVPPPAASTAVTASYTVIKRNDQANLNTNPDWIRASRKAWQMGENKSAVFKGTDDDMAEYGKSIMGYFFNNIVAMTARAHDVVTTGTTEDKEAFLYLMDQYEENMVSWAGVGRAVKGALTDPANVIGLGTLGGATLAKIAASAAARTAMRQALLQSLGRTGIQAGILGGIQGGVTNTIKQTVEVSGGRKDSIGLGEQVVSTAIGAGAGLVLGTGADALLSVAAPAAKVAMGKIAEVLGLGKKVKAVVPEMAPAGVLKEAPTVAPKPSPVGEAGLVPTEAPRPAAAAPDPTSTLPISSDFTEAELKALGTRGQKGRLWTDDIPVQGPIDERAANALVIPESTPGLRATPRSMVELNSDAEKVAAQLRVLDGSPLKESLEKLRNKTPIEDIPTVFRAVQILHDDVRVAEATLLKQINAEPLSPLMRERLASLAKLQERKIDIAHADDSMGTFGGSLNRQRQEGLVGLQGHSVQSLMTEKGLTKEAAEVEYGKLIDASQVSSKAKQIKGEYDAKVAAAIEAGDLGEAGKQMILKGRELAGVAEEAAPGGSTWASKRHTLAAGTKELMISNLFTIKTVLINAFPAAVKTLVIPTAKFLVTNPLEKAARAELGAHYSAMGATLRGAFSAAHAAMKYEQSILTRDHSRILEGEMVMRGKLGGALRFFPRVLNATDEFLSQLNYAGFISGKAAHTAAIDGAASGLEGRALNAYIKEAVTKAQATMYEGLDESMVQPIINKGVNLGLSGDDLVKYVEVEAVKNPLALRHGNDKVALQEVRDVLYKRAFSGEGGFSNAAKSYETFVHKNPSMALIVGQLFFRTPIRVFEEGIRLTPGVQILAPGFIKDLAGGNGQMRQVRAQAESMIGLGITGAALSLYAAGSITGSGVYNNYKQDKTRKDGPAPEPYTIRFDDGSTWSFKGMDPLATSLKIIINAFEGMDQLKIKEAQEQFENKPAYRLLQARMYVGLMAITSAITDASLVSGLKGTVDLVADVASPMSKEDAILKKVGSYLAMMVPNTFHKTAQVNDPRMRDPATFFQIIEARLGHGLVNADENKSSFAYDPLGQIRSVADTGSMWNIFSTATQAERNRDHSEAHQKVMLEFDRLARETGAVFTAPTPKNPLTGDLDLRTMMTKDGKETMFDRWQGNYRALNPDRILLPTALSAAPHGTFKEKGMKVEALQGQMKFLQDAAFYKLLTDERLRERLQREALQKARAQGGLLDFNR